jgi:hypothetical protein
MWELTMDAIMKVIQPFLQTETKEVEKFMFIKNSTLELVTALTENCATDLHVTPLTQCIDLLWPRFISFCVEHSKQRIDGLMALDRYELLEISSSIEWANKVEKFGLQHLEAAVPANNGPNDDEDNVIPRIRRRMMKFTHILPDVLLVLDNFIVKTFEAGDCISELADTVNTATAQLLDHIAKCMMIKISTLGVNNAVHFSRLYANAVAIQAALPAVAERFSSFVTVCREGGGGGRRINSFLNAITTSASFSCYVFKKQRELYIDVTNRCEQRVTQAFDKKLAEYLATVNASLWIPPSTPEDSHHCIMDLIEYITSTCVHLDLILPPVFTSSLNHQSFKRITDTFSDLIQTMTSKSALQRFALDAQLLSEYATQHGPQFVSCMERLRSQLVECIQTPLLHTNETTSESSSSCRSTQATTGGVALSKHRFNFFRRKPTND